MAESHEHSEEDDEVGVHGGGQWRHDVRQVGHEHAGADHVLGPEPAGEVAAGYLRHHVAPEKRAEHQAL